MIENIILGSQAINNGFELGADPNTTATFIKKIYINIIPIPKARLTPVPPLFFLEDNDTAINVNIYAETGKLVR